MGRDYLITLQALCQVTQLGEEFKTWHVVLYHKQQLKPAFVRPAQSPYSSAGKQMSQVQLGSPLHQTCLQR
jgi:hypothetical protein